MADQAHEWTDEQIEALRRKFHRTYNQAAREMRTKLDDLMADFDTANKDWLERLRRGTVTHDEYDAWLKQVSMDRSFIGGMADTLANDAVDANRLVADYINDRVPMVYAENANRAAFEVESGIGYDTRSFDLYDQSTVRRLIAEDSTLVREVRPDKAKDLTWNRQKFNGAITQSILQGESIPNTAKRLRTVLSMNENAAVRAARTAMTCAENAGRTDSYKRAKRLGIELEQEWMATLDQRTRHSHRELDGQHVPVGEKFKVDGIELEYPGDPTAPGEYVWNCRCTLVAWFPDIEQEDPGRWSKLPEGMTYDEWKQGKQGRTSRFANQNALVWQSVGEDVHVLATEMLENADSVTAQVWAKYEQDLILHDGNGKRAYYLHGEGVTMNVGADMANLDGRGRLCVWFHEFGHHIDYLAAKVNGTAASREAVLAETVKREVQQRVNDVHKKLKAAHRAALDALDTGDFNTAIGWLENSSYGYLAELYRDALKNIGNKDWFYEQGFPPWLTETSEDQLAFLRSAIGERIMESKPTKAKVYDILEKEIRGLTDAEKHSLSDMFEGATSGRVQAGWGHGKSYWGRGDRLSTEAFAEFYSAECIYSETPETLDTLRRYLPESYKKYREILEEALGE